jgi:type II secretory ATPase GspE/PulE/Tfp pilus assembly ATPase PilB-like protein
MRAMAGDGEQRRVRMVCDACRSEGVTRYGWAEWNVEAQEWRIGAVFDHAFCHRCRSSTHVEAVPIGA